MLLLLPPLSAHVPQYKAKDPSNLSQIKISFPQMSKQREALSDVIKRDNW